MAQLALGAVGAVVGGYFGGPAGASIGWSIGSTVGAIAFAEKQNAYGPKLDQIRFGQSSYGIGVPLIYGAMRVGGNVIWAGAVEEVANKQKVGKNAYQTSYRYLQSFAVGLCAGPVAGVRKIWLDSKLVYSNNAADVIETLASGAIEEQMTVYLGSESQLADATIESEEGVGEVPAYRGLCYLVFEQLDLTQFGNRIPSVTAEVIEAGSFAQPTQISTLELSAGLGSRVDGNTILRGQWSSPFSAVLEVVDAATGTVISSTQFTSDSDGYNHDLEALCINDPGIAVFSSGNPDPPPSYSSGKFALMAVIYDPTTGTKKYVTSTGDHGEEVQAAYSNACVKLGSYLYTFSEGKILYRFPLTVDGVGAYADRTWNITTVDTSSGTGSRWVTTDGTYIYAATDALTTKNGYVFKFDTELNLLEEIDASSAVADSPNFAVFDGMLLTVSDAFLSTYTLTQSRLNGDGTITVMGSDEGSNTGWWPQQPFLAPLGNGVVAVQDGEWTMIPQLAATGRTLAQVVTSICGQAGIAAGEIDVTDIAGITVSGYLLDRRTSARSAIEPLLAAYGVDAVESNGRIRFVERGGSSSATIEQADLGAEPEGGSSDSSALSTERHQQGVLPRRVDVNYADIDAAFEVGSQPASRSAADTDQQITVNLPIAMTAAQAAQTAHRLLYETWASRTRREFSTGVKWSHLEPTDVVLIEDDLGTLQRMRLTEKSEDDGLLRWAAVADDDGAPTQYAAGVSLPAPGGIVTVAGSTQAVIFESPPIRDAEAYQTGVQVVAAPFSGTWPGGALWTASPGDTDYTLAGELTTQGVIGQATTALADYDATEGQARPDAVDVSVFGGSLATISESAWLAGGNLAVVGNELLHFKTATDLGGGEYRLSGLLRGAFGSDYAGTGHAASEGFALLSDLDAVHFVPMSSAYLGVTRDLRAVTAGQSVDAVTAAPYVLLGRTLKPLAPVNVTIVRQSNGDRTIRWQRRTRAYQTWREAVDIPQLEATESYVVQVYETTGNTLVYSGTSSSESHTYAAADWAADFPLPPSTVRILVWQVSAIVGAGEVADVTLQWAGDYNANYSRNWDDSSVALMTAYGLNPSLVASTPSGSGWPVSTKAVYLQHVSGGNSDAKALFPAVSSFVNGTLTVYTPKIYVLLGTTLSAGLLARTTYWRNNTAGYGYVVRLLHGTGSAFVQLAYGTNSDTSSLTSKALVSLGTTNTDVCKLTWVLNGTSHKVYVDDVLFINVTDSTHTGAGQCGLYVGGDSGASANFDNFNLDYLST